MKPLPIIPNRIINPATKYKASLLTARPLEGDVVVLALFSLELTEDISSEIEQHSICRNRTSLGLVLLAVQLNLSAATIIGQVMDKHN